LSSFAVRWVTYYLGLIIATETVLGLMGWLTVMNLLICLGLALAIFLVATRDKLSLTSFDWQSAFHRFKDLVRETPELSPTLFLVAWLALALVINLLLIPATMVDSLTYHLPMAVNWLKSGRITPFYLPNSDISNSYFPGNGELLYLWVMVPFRNDLLVRLVNVGMWGVLMLAIYRLSRKGGVSAPTSLGMALLFAFTPIVLSQAVDLWLDMAAVAIFLLALDHLFDFARTLHTGDLVRFSIAAGIFLGIKYSGPAYLLFLLLAWGAIILWKRHEYSWQRIGIHALVLGAGISGLGGLWYFRNILLTGNPIFPIQITVMGHTLLPGMYDSGSYHHITLGKNLNPDILTMMAMGWGVVYGGIFLLLCFPALGFLVRYIIERGQRFRETLAFKLSWRDFQTGLLIIIGVGSTVLYLRTPYSIMRFSTETPITVQHLIAGARLGLTVSVLCTIIAARGWQSTPYSRLLWIVLPISLIQGLLAGFAPGNYHGALHEPIFRLTSLWGAFLLVLVLPVLVSVVCPVQVLSFWKRYRFAAILLIMLGVIVSGVGFYALQQEREQNRIVHYQQRYGSLSEGWRWIAENIWDARIAYTGGVPLNYPLYGLAWRNDVRYVNIAGGLDDRYHDFWHRQSYWRDGDYETWRHNLLTWGADYLVVGQQHVLEESAWIAAHPEHFTEVFANDQIRIYRVDP